jgi:galactose oxidase
MTTRKDVGEWEAKFKLKNVCVHASLLPNGKVLYWGRRSDVTASLNEQKTLPYIWDPSKPSCNSSTAMPQPLNKSNQDVNLFCSGHCFQPDGKLLVVGGHKLDGVGIRQSCVFDPIENRNKWTALEPMAIGRWYPSVITLPDGSPLVVGGNKEDKVMVTAPQIFSANSWDQIHIEPPSELNLYPRIFITPKGDKVFMAGPQATSQFLNLNTKAWEPLRTPDNKFQAMRSGGVREYAASVLYDVGKIMYFGGGTNPPTDIVQVIDLNADKPEWTTPILKTKFKSPRQQCSTTVLPDGTVLLTGGTGASDFNNLGFDDNGQRLSNVPLPIHTPELWNPETGAVTVMAPEDDDRCYHSIALLLLDGRILSAGGGEWAPKDNKPNADRFSLKTAQVFSPPYLFDINNLPATRPTFTIPKIVFSYNEPIDATVGTNDKIKRVSWIRLGSVTHCTNFNQAVVFQKDPPQAGTRVSITSPASSNIAPPGHYMLFLLNTSNVPAIAQIVRLKGPDSTSTSTSAPATNVPRARIAQQPLTLTRQPLDEKIIAEQDRPPVIVGLTPACPYGLGPCWGGAFEGLKHITDVGVVRPLPSHEDSVAFVYTKQDALPDIDVWRAEFQKVNANTHAMRGIEMTFVSAVSSSGAQLVLAGAASRPDLVLEQLRPEHKVQWDAAVGAPQQSSDEELNAYADLSAAVAKHPGAKLMVTGPLQKHGDGKFTLEVREFEVVDGSGVAV